jgi:photosynthetic reaction center cytochrome c subunit
MTFRTLALTIALLAAQPPAPAQPPPWQPPDPTNLQVLARDTPKPELIRMMRSFTRALGVRCEFCHLGEGNDLSRFDFASDDRRQKRNARLMLRMVADLNGTYLAGVPEPRSDGTPAVTCYTCHRGETKPITVAPPRD